MNLHIVVSDHLDPAGWDVLRSAPDVTLAGPFEDRAAVLDAVAAAAAIIIRSGTQADRELIDRAPGLRVIARAGAHLENVDIDEATRRGIMVLHVPDANVVAVAEHTLAMLLALARQIPRGNRSLREGRWERHQIVGRQLKGQTLGVVGYGRHGRAVAARAQAFGMHVLAFDPYIDFEYARQQHVEVVPLAEMLARADIVSLHTAVTPETVGMFNREAFRQMKTGAWFVNCTRSELVDEGALLDALDSGQIGAAALDTFTHEPPPPADPLVQHPHVLAVPHLNQNTRESQRDTSVQVAQQVLDALCGSDYVNVVNLPFTTDTQYRNIKPYLDLAEKLGKVQGQLADGFVNRVELQVTGDGMQRMVRPLAAALLVGLLHPVDDRAVNYVSAPTMAHEQNIQMAQVIGLDLVDYPNLISCRVCWEGGERTVAGVLFAGEEARLVQYGSISIDARPQGELLFLENDDVPGVIGKVGMLLGDVGVNIGEWRYGRNEPGGQAVSFINLDSECPPEVIARLNALPEVWSAKIVRL
ncbi:MAG: phosphoglycerate dehydrogenase [Anaerolineales bacterium]